MIKQPYITIFFALLFLVSIVLVAFGYSKWWCIGIVLGFYGFIIAFLEYISVDED